MDYDPGTYAFYGRAEWVQKSTHELNVEGVPEDAQPVAALTLGVARDLLAVRGLTLTLGGQGTIYRVPEAYGRSTGHSRPPWSCTFGSRPA